MVGGLESKTKVECNPSRHVHTAHPLDINPGGQVFSMGFCRRFLLDEETVQASPCAENVPQSRSPSTEDG